MNKQTDWPANYLELFWSVYPRRIAKKAAAKALEKVRKSGEINFEVLISAVQRFAISVSTTEMQFIPHPATWINGGRWDDDTAAIAGTKSRTDVGLELAAELRRREEAAGLWGNAQGSNGAVGSGDCFEPYVHCLSPTKN